MIRYFYNISHETSGIIEGFDRTLFDAFSIAVEKGNTHAWKKILEFTEAQGRIALNENSIFLYRTFLNIPIILYSANQNNSEVANYIASEHSNYLSTFSYRFRINKIVEWDQAHRSALDIFYTGVMSFYHYLIHHPDD